ncbi:hypothetical protein CON82_30465 [Bacillus wiedmannii]|nr:hypothetical protein CON82_30465 [Bacillus wiedmannii]
MESSRNQYGFPVMNNEIIYVSRVFALKQKELVVISTSSFCFSYCIRKKTFKYSRNSNEVFISRLLTKILYFNRLH